MEHYKNVARTLMERPARYGLLFCVDTRNDDVLWELWIGGFEKAVALRPAAWKELLDADADTAAAMSGMLLLAEIARGDKEVELDDPILTAAPDKIADWVVILNEWRLANYQPIQDIGPTAFTAPGDKGRSQRTVPMRLRQEIQEMLRAQLIETAVLTECLL
nr:UPF0149 family protein [Bradyrhizobium sp. CCBAU 51765]